MAFRNILRVSNNFLQQSNVNRAISLVPSRSSSFLSSEVFKGVEKHPEVEIIRNPPEWKYVEQLLGKETIPVPTVKSEYPSGWTPPDPARYKKLPYFIKRSRNYMVPVYLELSHRDQRRLSLVKNIEGDIWKLEQELHELIEKRVKKTIYSRINEMNRQIVFKGDYVTLIQKYLISKGL